MKIFLIVLGCFLFVVFLAADLLTPSTWRWSKSNLQVKIHNLANEKKNEGKLVEGFGWSKSNLLDFNWSRRSEGIGQNGLLKYSTDLHIVGISRDGVSVHVRYEQTLGNTKTSFDKLIFVPSYGEAHIDVPPDFSITGAFE